MPSPWVTAMVREQRAEPVISAWVRRALANQLPAKELTTMHLPERAFEPVEPEMATVAAAADEAMPPAPALCAECLGVLTYAERGRCKQCRLAERVAGKATAGKRWA